MQVSVEAMNGLKCKMTVKVPSTTIEQKVGVRLKDLAKTAKLPGFRPGKVPLSVVKQKMGNDVRQEVIGELIRTTLYQALDEQKINAAGTPSIEPMEMNEGKDLEYVATFEKYPEFKVATLENCEINTITSKLTSADVDGMFEKLQKQNMAWEKVASKAELDYKVKIDFEGYLDDEKFDGGSAKDHELVLGSGSMIPGFEEQIIGAQPGAKVTIKLNFPADYHHRPLAGKAARFEVTVHDVYAPILPELNDEFAKKFDITEGGIDKLRQEITKNMERELEMRLNDKNKQIVFDELVKRNPIDVPTVLVDSEVRNMQNEMYNRITGGKKVDRSKLPELPRELFEPQAKRRVQLGLIVSEYVNEHKIKADTNKINQMIEKMSEAYDEPQEWVTWFKSSKQRLANVEAAALEEQVVEKLLERAKVHNINKDYFAVIEEKSASDSHVHGPDCDHDHDHDHDHVHGPDCDHD